MFDFVAAAYS